MCSKVPICNLGQKWPITLRVIKEKAIMLRSLSEKKVIKIGKIIKGKEIFVLAKKFLG